MKFLEVYPIGDNPIIYSILIDSNQHSMIKNKLEINL